MKTVTRFEVEHQYDVLVEQRANGKFRVTYGALVMDGLDYTEAAKEFGFCAFHALACAGRMVDEYNSVGAS